MLHPNDGPRRSTAPPGAWQSPTPEGSTLSEHDLRYLAERGVDERTARAAGYWSALKPSEIPDVYSSYFRRQAPALIAPHFSPDGETVGFQIHPERPRKNSDGDILKWISPKADKAPVILSVHPWTADEVRTGDAPLWACEGLTRGHALAPLGIAAVTYPGCWSWQKGGEALKCWQHCNLRGRLLYLVPDADHTIKENVQQALAAQVAYLESKGATVLLVKVPEVNGDADAGLDDYIAAADDPLAAVEDLRRAARPFVPVDVGRERLARSTTLGGFVRAKLEEIEALPASGRGDANALKLARYLAGVRVAENGKRAKRGYIVWGSYPQMAEAIRVGSYQTIRNALDRLEALEYLKTLKDRHGRRSYLLLDPWGGGCAESVKMRGQGVAGKEGQECRRIEETSLSKRESSLSLHSLHISRQGEKLPALRNSKLVHTYAIREGRKVVVHTDYFKRYGAKREEILRYVLDRGRVEGAELHERFGSKTSRPGRFFETWVERMIRDGVLAGEWGGVELAADWMEALERVRERTDEEGDNERQSRKYAERLRSYRERLAAERRGEIGRPERTPELAGPERTAHIVEAAKERDHAARVEEQRRKVGTTPETFLVDALQDVSGFGWRELRALWTAKGGKSEDLRRAVKAPYRFNREGGDGALYVERAGASPEPEHKPAPVAVLRETQTLKKPESENLTKPYIAPAVAEDWRSHPLDCPCCDCAAPMPTYARAWSGA